MAWWKRTKKVEHAHEVTCPDCIQLMETHAAVISLQASILYRMLEAEPDGTVTGEERRALVLHGAETVGAGVIAMAVEMGADKDRIFALMGTMAAQAEAFGSKCAGGHVQ